MLREVLLKSVYLNYNFKLPQISVPCCKVQSLVLMVPVSVVGMVFLVALASVVETGEALGDVSDSAADSTSTLMSVLSALHAAGLVESLFHSRINK